MVRANSPNRKFESSTTHKTRQKICHHFNSVVSGKSNSQAGDDVCLEEQGKGRQTNACVC
jgi:hypothetical protein